jgi:predicted AAA+ superfamily ATPase
VYVRDSGLVHALLGLGDFETVAGHPVIGSSWEGFVIENLIALAPPRTTATFYRTSAGAEIDLVLEIPGHGLWAFEIKRSLIAKPDKGFYYACDDIKPAQRYMIHGGEGRYPLRDGVEAIGLRR